MLASVKHSLLHHPSLKCCHAYLLKIVHVGNLALHIIREEIFTLVELHGIQKKCGVNDNKTKR